MSSDRATTSGNDHAKLCTDVRAAVRSNASLLISGERQAATLVARLVHERSGRQVFARACPKVFSEGLAAFGGSDGSSTTRREVTADDRQWTLFIEDIDQLTRAAQERLFHLIGVLHARDSSASPERNLGVRVMGASAQDLSLAVAAGTFQQDLFYRLNAIHLALPSVGAHNEGTTALVDSLLQATAGSVDPDTHPLSVQDLERLLTFEPTAQSAAWQSLLTFLG